MKTQLRRIKSKKGEMEGRPYDFTRIWIDIPVYDRSEGEYGVAEMELEFGLADEVKKIEHLIPKLPLPVEVEFYAAKKGSGNVYVVTRLAELNDKPVPKLQQPN